MVSKKNLFFTGKKACVRIFMKFHESYKRAQFILLKSFLDLYKTSLRFKAQFTLSTFTAFNFSRKINYTRARTSTFSAVFFQNHAIYLHEGCFSRSKSYDPFGPRFK
jgi:hypothetical protein